jgi:tripartite-type tricarboxylate transporter receptor subunit TctC
LFGAELARIEGLKLNHIPYKGGGAAMVDLIGGHVKIATITFSSVIEQVLAGQLRALAVSSEHRLATVPNVPTFAELGHPDLVSSSWFALSGPKGLPSDIVARLNHEAAVALQRPEARKILDNASVETRAMSPEETMKFFQAETVRWAPLAREMQAADSGK